MRRKDREITDRNQIIEVMRKCDVVRLALNDGDYPYILPLNFGLHADDNAIELYFHGAMEGRKYEIMEKDNRASFEMDCEHVLASDIEKGKCTMNYASVIGKGHIFFIEGEEKKTLLDAIVAQYHPEGFEYNPAAISRTKVYKLVVEEITGKVK